MLFLQFKTIIIMSKKEHSILKVTPYAHRYSFHLKGQILEPEYYVDYFEELSCAGSDDIIDTTIGSYGGNLSTAIELRNLLLNSLAHVHCSVVSDCMSAATIPLLAADTITIADHSRFMFHNYSGGIYGNGHEIITNATFDDTWSRNLWKDVYKNFLSEVEIDNIINGQTIYMDSEEVKRRFEILKKEKTDNG